MCREMPPKEVVLHRPITRSKVSNNETSSIFQESASMPPTSTIVLTDFPPPSPSPPPPHSSLSRSPHLVEDAQGIGSQSHPPSSENATCSIKKRGHGASTRKSIEKAIADNVWFDIKGWWSDQLITTYMEEMFQRAHTHWRGRLSESYKKRVLAGDDSRASSPFDWIPLQKWRVLCDHFEIEKFKKRSKINAENRSHLPYSHTSGSKSFQTRLLKMEKQSDVDNFANTHMKNGVFINETAAGLHTEMVNIRNQAKESNGSEVSEREIVKQKLGKRTGCEKSWDMELYLLNVPRNLHVSLQSLRYSRKS
ncbi:hypothetical protein BUALT_Bualt10G0037300 [Buddleja alternifolia]|uniref:Transposase n=1 Tax=Buddleja alternifolia TaxID=168488 RepID=A0AAV6X3Y0_9LAMI|nr:hypothetical protein BUALT_Bualt10G0037300 [Buddleja alternifolia]